MTLLYIDDDLDDRLCFNDALKNTYKTAVCHMASSGQEGLALLKRIIPDYIFLDQNMPGMPGREVLKLIRNNPAYDGVKIIMFSTNYGVEDVTALREFGANGCMLKPNSVSDLRTLLTQTLH